MHNYLSLKDKVALVTGASSGIGAATATLFAELGAKVAIGFHSNKKGAELVLNRITEAGGNAIICAADVTQVSAIESLIERVTDALGPIDILVNNAGSLLERLPILELTEGSWDAVM